MAPTVGFRSTLDRDVYQIIKRLEAQNDSQPLALSVPALYEAIRLSNSSLSRQKKRPLEDAIGRAIEVIRDEQQQDASDDSEAAIDTPAPPAATDDRFLLNRQLTKLWKTDAMSRIPNEQPATKRRRVQGNGGDERGSGTETPDVLPGSKPDRSKVKTQQRSSRHIVEEPGLQKILAGYEQIDLDLTYYARLFLHGQDDYLLNCPRLSQGILVSGPPGVGKRTLVRNLAINLRVPLIFLKPCFLQDPERVEKSLSEAFDAAISQAPSIVLVEQIDRCTPSPASMAYSDAQNRVTCSFAKQMARICPKPTRSRVLVLATTSRVANIDPDILKTGLISSTVQMRIPDCAARREILGVLSQDMNLAEDVNLDEIAKATHGYVGADLAEIMCRSSSNLVKRVSSALAESGYQLSRKGLEHNGLDVSVEMSSKPASKEAMTYSETMEDFKTAMKDFTPSLRKEGFTAIPSVTWEQVGALDKARKQLQTSIVGPIKNPQLYKDFGLNRPAGVLLWGPPGCGKTLIAQAVANEAQASFILIDGPELLNKYVGESERAVRELFQRARSSTPCILFFDEIDSVVPPRGSASTDSGARVVNALLAELDGVKDRTGIYVIGTTNRPEMIDEAMLRPGRLSIQLLVDLPTPSDRVEILRAIYRTCHGCVYTSDEAADGLTAAEEVARLPSTDEVPDRRTDGPTDRRTKAALDRLLANVALDDRCANFSGADLSGLHSKAGEHALETWVAGGGVGPRVIARDDWEYALANTSASVKDLASYKLRTARFT